MLCFEDCKAKTVLVQTYKHVSGGRVKLATWPCLVLRGPIEMKLPVEITSQSIQTFSLKAHKTLL